MGTIGPSESCSIGEEIERLGGQYLEAPVLGSIAEAKAVSAPFPASHRTP
jgi:3-hydroxyisobutyrate dehydrogenase